MEARSNAPLLSIAEVDCKDQRGGNSANGGGIEHDPLYSNYKAILEKSYIQAMQIDGLKLERSAWVGF